MDHLIEPSDLLSESDIISEEEKREILAEIDKGFLSRSQKNSDLSQISAKSNGLTLPLTIAALAVISTILILLFSSNLIVQNNETRSFNEFTNISGSEWEILKIYMQESTKKLENKNSEIGRYKEEIVSYDRRLTTLRELLNIKRDTENKLVAERAKLRTEGIADEEITSKITALEENLISELAPGMITFYNLSIDDLNEQIEQVLDDKTKSEEKLKTSIVEREVLVTENEKIQEEAKVKEVEILLIPEVIETLNKMNEITDHYESENLVRKQIADLYLKIFNDLDGNEHIAALGRIDELRNLLTDSEHIEDHTGIDQLPMQIKIVDTLKKYVNKSLISADLSLSEKSEYEKVIDKWEVPNSTIIQEDTLQNDQGLETDLISLSVAEEENDPKELILFGVVSFIQFDRVIIESISGFNVLPGTEFHIINRKDQTQKLGVGVITEVLSKNISGLLVSSSHPSGLPEADDLIFIKLDTIDKN